MNWDTFEGHWRMLKGKTAVRWGTLTKAPATVIRGTREQRFGRVQLRHGIARDEAPDMGPPHRGEAPTA
jgi:uncharacterized protein YjbJ (UPF0337 family)